jgi:hypothetical protein
VKGCPQAVPVARCTQLIDESAARVEKMIAQDGHRPGFH